GGRRGEGADGDAGAAGRVAVVVVHPGGAEEADGLRLGTGGGARGGGGAARGSVRLVRCCAHVSIVTRPPRPPGAPLPAGAVGPCPAASAEGCACRSAPRSVLSGRPARSLCRCGRAGRAAPARPRPARSRRGPRRRSAAALPGRPRTTRRG